MKKRINVFTILLALVFLFPSAFFTGCSADGVVSTANIISGGDLLISETILEGAKTDDGVYDFNYIFKYAKDYIKDADYAVINLETSIGGEEAGYCGFPLFNTPESIIEAAKDAGFDMFLTASNHSYDLGYDAVINKINTLEEYGVDYIGTRKDETEDFHKIIEVNGIKIGMLNYTRQTSTSTKEKVILNSTTDRTTGERNHVVVDENGQKLIASYNNDYLDEFYDTLKADIETLKNDGADIITVYPHWGTEYNIFYNELEDEMAQTMCDYGVDIIIGGHPHVVEPVKVYTSEISGKTTVCIHSTGNFVSSMRSTQDKNNAAYTEDGVLFEYTISKYKDGHCEVSSVSALPLWVKNTKGKKYTVIPLDEDVNWEKEYNVYCYSEKTSSGYQSFLRTKDLVDAGIEEFNNIQSK